jgi:hypothetical protein
MRFSPTILVKVLARYFLNESLSDVISGTAVKVRSDMSDIACHLCSKNLSSGCQDVVDYLHRHSSTSFSR